MDIDHLSMASGRRRIIEDEPLFHTYNSLSLSFFLVLLTTQNMAIVCATQQKEKKRKKDKTEKERDVGLECVLSYYRMQEAAG
jgi:hypothetical protein